MNVNSLSAFLAVCLLVSQVSAQTPPSAFDGSYRLDDGTVISGGVFVESGPGRFLYMDTDSLQKGGLFERVDDRTLRSLFPPGIEIEFTTARDGVASGLVWRERGSEQQGRRVFRHRSTPVRFTSADGARLDGRLLRPACAGPHPAVVIVHGSGPVDRHGGPYDMFFLKHGIAVLAYDKRGYTTDRDQWREPDLATLSADAAAAVRFVAQQPDVDTTRIGIMGHSQAGWVVPRAALDAPQSGFLVLRAGAALTQKETLLHEVRQELRAEGLRGLDLDHAMDLRNAVYELAIAGRPMAAADSLVAPYLTEPWYVKAFGDGSISTRWSQDFWEWAGRNLPVSAIPQLERFHLPVLWFLAEQDENVPLVATRTALERSLNVANRADREVVVLEDALHSFLVPQANGPPRFSPGYFSKLAAWLNQRGIARSACFAR